MDKARLRKEHHGIREREAKRAGGDIQERLLAKLGRIPGFADAKTVLMYWSKPAEAPTHHIIEALLSGGKRVALPCSIKESQTLDIHVISSTHELVRGTFGVLEPDPRLCRPITPGEIDVAVIPGVAFDDKGRRLGHGMGYYDRLLKGMACPKVGLCFDAQISQKPLPCEAHDVDMDYVVSEKRLIKIAPLR